MTRNEYKLFEELLYLKAAIIDLLTPNEEKIKGIFNGVFDNFQVQDWYIYMSEESYIDIDFLITCDRWVNSKGIKIDAAIDVRKVECKGIESLWRYITDSQYELILTFIGSPSFLSKEDSLIMNELKNHLRISLPKILKTLKENWDNFWKGEGEEEFGLNSKNGYLLKHNEL